MKNSFFSNYIIPYLYGTYNEVYTKNMVKPNYFGKKKTLHRLMQGNVWYYFKFTSPSVHITLVVRMLVSNRFYG